MLTAASCLLVFIGTLRSVTTDQIQLSLSSVGFEFTHWDSNILLANISDANNHIQCVTACLHNLRCRTTTFDPSMQQCLLFSAWIFEGATLSSASPTTQIGFIPQEASLYTAYLQACTSSSGDPISRYMQCVNGAWICPDRQFFNGYVCEYKRRFDASCQSDDWCDSSAYLICSNWSRTCRCNSSMRLGESECYSCKRQNHHRPVDHFQHPFSLSSGTGGNPF